MLTNPGFDSPAQPAIGNNLTGLYTFNGWTMTGGPVNVIRSDGSSYGGGPDNAKNGNQYIDITNGAGVVYQNFTITAATVPVSFSGHFSSREQGYVNWTAGIQIINNATNAVMGSSTTRNFTNADGAYPQQETWYYLYGNATLPPGNYRYEATIGDFGNFDAAELSVFCILATHVVTFTGHYINGNAILNWTCDQTNDLSHFEIERSSDGNNFTVIGKVNAWGNQVYSFTDNAVLLNTTNYYRIKMVDKDGKFSYSAVISIKTKGDLSVRLSPNPVIDILKINGLSGKGELNIYDISGRLVLQKYTALTSVSLDASQFNKGMYVVKYFDGQTTSVQKFSKL